MKFKPVIIVLVTLIIGFSIGFLTSSIITHQKMKRFTSFNSVETFKRITIGLIEPTEEQRKEILPLIDEYGKKMDQIRKEFGKEFFNLMKEFHNALKPYLTPEQIEKLENIQRPGRGREHRSPPGDSTGRGRRHRRPPPPSGERP